MIIECINCNKKFNVDSKLIPSDGRQIQCGSCNHSWHYIFEEVSSKTLVLDNFETLPETKSNVNQDVIDSEKLFKHKISKSSKQDTDYKVDNSEIKNKNISNFFSLLLVIFISFAALLVLIDTIKSPLINIFPQLEIVLFNLFETFTDIKLFIIDLT